MDEPEDSSYLGAASVQYNDWLGTAAADSLDQTLKLGELLDLDLGAGERVVGFKVYIGEGGRPIVGAYIAGPEVAPIIDSDGSGEPEEIAIREEDLSLSLEAFLALFKRLNIRLLQRSLNRQGTRLRVE